MNGIEQKYQKVRDICNIFTKYQIIVMVNFHVAYSIGAIVAYLTDNFLTNVPYLLSTS